MGVIVSNDPWWCTCGHSERYHGADGCAHLDGHDEYCACPAVPPKVAAEQEVQRRAGAKRCTAHPRYRALRRPSVACEGCWRMWIQVHP